MLQEIYIASADIMPADENPFLTILVFSTYNWVLLQKQGRRG